VKWIAQDQNGAIWGFEAEPHLHDYGWYENEVGRYRLLMQAEKNADWAKHLIPIAELENSILAPVLTSI
ncbi:MAG: hypothetical protein R3240_01970, partial [Gammaproteobacteria bacterium]|nr:hypothetical protein [Gammaproteobacteria bacterium]